MNNLYPTLEQQARHLDTQLQIARMYSQGINVTDPTRAVTLRPTYLDRERPYIQRVTREEMLEQEKLERQANQPILFKLCRRLNTTLKDILK